MATISVSIGNMTRSWTIPPAHLQRVLAAYKASFTVDDGAGGQRVPTDREVFDLLARGFVDDLRRSTREMERNAAVEAARAAVPDVDATED